jgi:glycosyltransferase involved in cell wall biosynthesis
MLVDFTATDDPSVTRVSGDRTRWLRIMTDQVPRIVGRLPDPANFSAGLCSGISRGSQLATGADVVNVHWINFGFASIRALGRLPLPSVWTLHDMWTLTGGVHYAEDVNAIGSPWESWVLRRKRTHWRAPVQLVTPSRWLADQARRSAITAGWPVEVIPNPLDLEVFSPGDQREARSRLGLPPEPPIVLFALAHDLNDQRKGWDLLAAALTGLEASGVQLAIMGPSAPPATWPSGLPQVHWLGRLTDEARVADAYRSATVVVVPSRMDNLPQTATEAVACGVPVVAFAVGGLTDIVEHDVSGYLAEPFDVASLRHGLQLILEDGNSRLRMSAAARARAESSWSPVIVARRYTELFERVRQSRNA